MFVYIRRRIQLKPICRPMQRWVTRKVSEISVAQYVILGIGLYCLESQNTALPD